MCDTPLDPQIKTIAELLRNMGYLTFGMGVAPQFSAEKNYDKGFDIYYDFKGMNQIKGYKYELTGPFIRSALRALKFNRKHGKIHFVLEKFLDYAKSSIALDKPFFGFINLDSCHSPYNPPEDFKTEELRGIEGKISKAKLEFLRMLANTEAYKYMAGKLKATDEDWRIVRMMYESEMLYNDYLLGQTVSFLKEVGIYDQSMIIVTADHGENFGEHHLAYHQFCLYNTLLHVPLIIKTPKNQAFKTIKKQDFYGQTSLIDVPHSIARMFGFTLGGGIYIFNPEQAKEGHRDVYASYSPPVGALELIQKAGGTHSDFDNDVFTIITPEWKLIINTKKKEELYNINLDSQETENRAASNPEVATDLKKRFNEKFPKISLKIKKEDPNEYSEEIKRRLRALGYL
jgi:arylsulfatase A-like enzyme